MSNDAKAVKSGVWYTAANFITKSIGFLTTPLFARLLTKAEFGGYNNYASWLIILSIFVTLNLDSTFISARKDFREHFDEYISSCLALSFLSGVLWLGLVNLLGESARRFFGMNSIYLNCIFLYLLFLPAINLYQTRERYLFQYKHTVFVSLLLSITTAVLSVLLVKYLPNKLTGRVLGNTIPTVLIGVVLFVIIFANGRKVNIKHWKYALSICLPFIPHLLSLNVLNQVDRIMITSICGEESNALYSLGYSCGAIITLVITSLNGAVAPWIGEKLGEEKYDESYAFSKYYVIVIAAVTYGIMLLSPEIVLIMGGESYKDAVYVMPPITMGCFCQFLYIMYVNIEQFEKKTVGMALASVSAAALNYFLNALLIPEYGYIAAAYTTLIGYLWLALAHMLLVRRLGMSKVYNGRIVMISILCMCLLMGSALILYSQAILRYIIIVVYIGIIVYAAAKNRDMVVKLIRYIVK